MDSSVTIHSEKDGTVTFPKAVVRSLAGTQMILSLALFIIGCVAAAGHLNGVVAGGCMIGLSVPLVLIALHRIISPMTKDQAKFERRNAIMYLIIPLAMITIGSLAIAGLVTPAIGGWTAVASGPITIVVIMNPCCGVGCIPCCDMVDDCVGCCTKIQVDRMEEQERRNLERQNYGQVN